MTDICRAETVRIILKNFENEDSKLIKLASSYKVKRLWLNTKNLYTVNPANPNPKDDKDKENKKNNKE